MGRRYGPFATNNPWLKISLNVCFWLTAVSVLFGFLVLPAFDAGSQPIWGAICSAFGLRPIGATASTRPPARYASEVAWSPQAVVLASAGDPHRGAFVALNCAVCHGEKGLNDSGWIPNIGGMRAEATVKQLMDFKSGHRAWPVMNGIGAALSADDIRDVAAYYAELPSGASGAATAQLLDSRGTRSSDPTIRLIFAGDPRRGIAPCASCHGLAGLKRAAPALAGQQASYIERQLVSFQQRTRANDEGEQMRVIAAELTPEEIRDLSKALSASTGRQP